MKLQDIKTLDKLFDFFNAEHFYKVENEFPFSLQDIYKVEYPTIILKPRAKEIMWQIDKYMSFDNCILFDNYNEAKEYALRKRMEYSKKMFDDDKAELKKLKEGDNQ